jgi:hypothetical protein
MGVISGNMLVDGRERDESFQRKTGYVMQQDIHLETSTVREALEFSAVLRQPLEYSHTERLAYVDKVIELLDMQVYADAVVGVPGSGLNVERKSSCLSIVSYHSADSTQNASASPLVSNSPHDQSSSSSLMSPPPASIAKRRGRSAT